LFLDHDILFLNYGKPYLYYLAQLKRGEIGSELLYVLNRPLIVLKQDLIDSSLLRHEAAVFKDSPSPLRKADAGA